MLIATIEQRQRRWFKVICLSVVVGALTAFILLPRPFYLWRQTVKFTSLRIHRLVHGEPKGRDRPEMFLNGEVDSVINDARPRRLNPTPDIVWYPSLPK